MESKIPLHYINTFRAAAIVFIVAVHALHVFSWPDGDLTKQFLDILLNNGSLFFIFISGYLFQHLSTDFKPSKYYVSKFKNVVLPYLVISTPAVIFFVFVSQKTFLSPDFYQLPIWQQIANFYAFGYHLSPMWFLPVIITYYLLGPLLAKVDKTRFFYYTLPVFFILSFFVPRGLLHNNILHFFSIYMLGMFCSNQKILINNFLKKNVVLLVLLILVWAMLIFEYFINIKIANVNFFQKIIFTILLLSVFIKFESIFQNKIINTLAETSFGVFFIHSYVLGFFKFLSKQISYAQYLDLPRVSGTLFLHSITTVLVIFISVSVVLLINKILKGNAFWLIGSTSKLKTGVINGWSYAHKLS